MTTSFYNGISGVTTSQFALDTWANNISNINTNGFKANKVEFKTIFEQSLNEEMYGSVNNDAISVGASASSSAIDTKQGALLAADNIFDLAIRGKGWFGVKHQDNTISYTRNGEFRRDALGQLSDSRGNLLMGTVGGNINAKGETVVINDIALGGVAAQDRIVLPPNITMPGVATSAIFFGTNLDPSTIIQPDTPVIDQSDYIATLTNNKLNIAGEVENSKNIFTPKPDDIVLLHIEDKNGNIKDTFVQLDKDLKWSLIGLGLDGLQFNDINDLNIDVNLSTRQEISNYEKFDIEIFSPKGERDVLSFEFNKVVPQQQQGVTWESKAQILTFFERHVPNKVYDETQFVVNKDKGVVSRIVSSTSGILEFTPSGALLSNNIITLDNSGVPLEISLGSFFDGTPNKGYDGFTSFANADIDRQNVIEKNGYLAGKLNGYDVDQNGQIVAEFTNGKFTPVAKVAIFNFQNDQGLEKVEGSLFKQSANSGEAIFFENNELAGDVVSRRLESSNVDMSEALTALILYQKSLQASSKSITTADQMIQNAINMKR